MIRPVLYALVFRRATFPACWIRLVDTQSKSPRMASLAAQAVLYACMFVALALVGRDAHLGLPYWIGLGVALVLVGYEFAVARTRDPQACFRAFLHNNWVGMAIFAGIAADVALGTSG